MVLNTRLTLNTGHIFHLEKPNQVNYDKPLIIREIPIPEMLKWKKKKKHIIQINEKRYVRILTLAG